MLLDVQELSVHYGRTQAVQRMSLNIEAGEIVTVLGANGAGKSSLLKALQGMVKPAGGQVQFKGHSILGHSAARRVSEGLVLVPEGRQIFVSLSVHDNLLMGAYTRKDNPEAEIEAIYERFPNLAQRRDMPASVLSGGEQQMLAIARSLMARPTLLMLDEPSLGLAPKLVGEVMAALAQLHRDGLTILLVEQNAQAALAIADRGYVLEAGQLTLQGPARQLLADPSLRAAYLGG